MQASPFRNISRCTGRLGHAGDGSSGAEDMVAVKREAEGAAGASAVKKKAKKGPAHYQLCGRADDCTCAICKKARDQQVVTPYQ